MSIINRVMRAFLNYNLRKKLTNKNPSIISCNCIGGVMMHDLGLEFRSPTINLWFEPSDFIKYVKKLKYYNELELEEVVDANVGYPVGRLADIKIYFQHYPDFISAKEKWNKRKEKIDYSNLFVIFVQSEMCLESDIDDFFTINYPKVIFTSRELNKGKESVCVKEFEKYGHVKNLIPYINKCSGKRYYDVFDYVNWLNSKK